MDREQEQLQFLGFFGTIKESFKIIFSWKKIFTHITLTLILPLSIFYLVQIEISDLISSKYSNTSINNTNYLKADSIPLVLFKFVDFVIYLILYLLSTAAVVYTVACIYTAKQTTYKKVMKIVPKVWKRLLVTFLWSFAFVFVYHVVAVGVLALCIFLLSNTVAGIVVGVVIVILYLVGLVYITVIWQLASVVSVLEEKYGLKAMKKSRVLIKGKMGVAVMTLILFGLCFGGIDVLFERYVVIEWSRNLLISILVAIGCVVLLVPVTLLSLVVETIIYFICKSYHHENIDKSSLSDHLEEYLGDYVRLNRSKDVQLEQHQQPDSRVWAVRNATVHEAQTVFEVNIVEWAQHFVSERSNVDDGLVGSAVSRNLRIQVWVPPADGYYKINTDASLDVRGQTVGIGIVIRNSAGLVMASSSQKLAATFSPQVAEAVAILRGLQLALDSGLFPCILESDAEVVVNWINQTDVIFSEIGNIIFDINVLKFQVCCNSIIFVSRTANRVAHVLAKNSLSCVEDLFWLEDFPPCVDSLVTTERRIRL